MEKEQNGVTEQKLPRRRIQTARKQTVKPAKVKKERANKEPRAEKSKQQNKSAPRAPKPPKEPGKKPVKVVFLGGVGEIGKNMAAIECGNDIIIIDAGAIFPTEETPGFDLVVPDITYLIDNAKKIRALLLTHGHEDHIGGVPYLLKEIKVPVVGTKLTLALVDNKLREHRINDVKMQVVTPGDVVRFGCFSVRCINVNHSIAGSLAFAIDTPQGVIFHSGDYKIDLTPVAGEPIDLTTISEIGSISSARASP